jgi:EpsI family protein
MAKPGRYFPILVMLGAARVATLAFPFRQPAPLAHPLESVPRQIAGWQWEQSEMLDSATLAGLKPTSYISRSYQRQGERMGLFVAYFATQRGGDSIHSPKNCLPGSGWEIWRAGSLRIPVDGRMVTINNDSINNGERRLLMLYWYESGKRITASEYLGKFLLIRDAIVDRRTEASLVRLILPDQKGMQEQGAAFAADLIPKLQWCFGR